MADDLPAIAPIFAVGDLAMVYDDTQQQWLDDGKVLEVADAGVRVCFANGAFDCVLPPDRLKRLEPVFVHVYDLGPKPNAVKSVNNALRLLGAGVYHAGVEVYGREYTFGGPTKDTTKGQTGVFSAEPRECSSHRYRESVAVGHTMLTKAEVRALYQRMKPEWLAESYDLTRKNCCSFCSDFCRHIGVRGSLPPWITRLADAGGCVENVIDQGKLARDEVPTAPFRPGDFVRGLASISTKAASETLSSKPRPRGADAFLVLERYASFQRIEDSRMSEVLQDGARVL